MAARKLTEKQLFEIWLDIKYAKSNNLGYLKELTEEIYRIRARRRKLEKLEKQARDHYEELYGPMPKKYLK